MDFLIGLHLNVQPNIVFWDFFFEISDMYVSNFSIYIVSAFPCWIIQLILSNMCENFLNNLPWSTNLTF